MIVLVLNCGSSTVKFQLIETDEKKIASDTDRVLAKGSADWVGETTVLTLQSGEGNRTRQEHPKLLPDQALELILEWIVSVESAIPEVRTADDIGGVGHRIVHGGEMFKSSVRIDARVVKGIDACKNLAPLHNPWNLKGVRVARRILSKSIPQVAVFDTAFHATLPETAYLYGLPMELHRLHAIRKYGFHGTSHRYVSSRYRKMLGLSPERVNVITLHLGSGCSACAIKGGESVDTSMGFTPLEGLLMSTRSGDLDPAIVFWLEEHGGFSSHMIDDLLNKKSGLLGLSGTSADMRTLLDRESEHADLAARRAIDVFCHRVRKYIGAYFALLGGADAVIFTGGIGENSPVIRNRICDGLDCLGLVLDSAQNESIRAGEINTPDSRLKAFVIPTWEELVIARDTFRIVSGECLGFL
jgi:acetate kinase